MKKSCFAFIVMLLVIVSAVPFQVLASDQGADDPGYLKYRNGASRSFYRNKAANRAAGNSLVHDPRFDGSTIRKGIDVSKYNGTIDWKKVKASGIDFAFVRVGYRGYSVGNLAEDNYFRTNISGALDAGIQVGVYIFSQAITISEAKEEANFLLSRIKDSSITLPVVMDFEYAGSSGTEGRLYEANLSKKAATDLCLAFAETIKNAGYTPALYANKYMLEDDLDAAAISSNARVWLASWGNSANYSGDYTFWQYSDSGTVPGINGNVDLNLWYDAASPAVPSVSKISSLKTRAKTKNSLTLSWSKNSSAAKYEVYRSASPNGKFKKVASLSSCSWTNSSLTAGKEYYYKVRGVKTVNGVTYAGPFSAVIKAYTTKPYTRTAVTKSRSIIRSGAGSSYKKVVTVKKKKSLSVYCHTQDKGGAVWYKVKYKKGSKTYTGYIKGSLVSIKKTGTAVRTLKVRKGPGTRYKKKATLSKGAKASIKGTKKDRKGASWYKISYKKGRRTYTGYVPSKYIK